MAELIEAVLPQRVRSTGMGRSKAEYDCTRGLYEALSQRCRLSAVDVLPYAAITFFRGRTSLVMYVANCVVVSKLLVIVRRVKPPLTKLHRYVNPGSLVAVCSRQAGSVPALLGETSPLSSWYRLVQHFASYKYEKSKHMHCVGVGGGGRARGESCAHPVLPPSPSPLVDRICRYIVNSAAHIYLSTLDVNQTVAICVAKIGISRSALRLVDNMLYGTSRDASEHPHHRVEQMRNEVSTVAVESRRVVVS